MPHPAPFPKPLFGLLCCVHRHYSDVMRPSSGGERHFLSADLPIPDRVQHGEGPLVLLAATSQRRVEKSIPGTAAPSSVASCSPRQRSEGPTSARSEDRFRPHPHRMTVDRVFRRRISIPIGPMAPRVAIIQSTRLTWPCMKPPSWPFSGDAPAARNGCSPQREATGERNQCRVTVREMKIESFDAA